jgi:hypothetical protein
MELKVTSGDVTQNAFRSLVALPVSRTRLRKTLKRAAFDQEDLKKKQSDKWTSLAKEKTVESQREPRKSPRA